MSRNILEKILRKYLNILIKFGIEPERSRMQQREIILSNKMALLLMPIALTAMIFSLFIGNFTSFLFLAFFLVLLGGIFALNKYRLNFLSRLILSMAPALVLISPFVFGEFAADVKFHPFSYVIIGLAIFPLVLFYKRSESIILAALLLIHLTILIYFDVKMSGGTDNLWFYILPQLAFATLIVGAFQFLKREGRLIEDDLKNSYESLSQSNIEISMQKEEISAQNEFLNAKQLKVEEQASILARNNHELNGTKIELLKTIDKLQEARNKLLQKEAEAKSILNALNDHYLVAQYDLAGRPVSVNDKVKALLGELNPEEFKVIKPLSDQRSVHAHQRSIVGLKQLWPSIVAGKSLTIDIEIPFAEHHKYFSTTLAPLFDQNGQPYRVLAIAQDVSELMDKNEKIDKINDELSEKISEISQQNELLNFQQKEIFDKSEELKFQSEEIKAINESLEQRVKERTQILEEKNKQLAEYAFINSHVLRAPVSTMLGLINLISYSALPLKDQKICDHLLETAEALDAIVFKINSAIDSGSHFDRNYLEPEREFQPMGR
jgi:PAS domain-containing protein